MSDVTMMRTGAHVALLSPIRRAGILVAPPPSYNLDIGTGCSLHESDWGSIVRPLVRAGWTFVADADELPVTLATFADGSCALGLFPDFLERAGDEHEESELFAALLELLDQHAATL